MPGPERIEWRRSFPSRPLATLGWYLLCAVLVTALILALFVDEPERLSSGRPNPLAHLPIWTVSLAALGAVPFVLAVVRRPLVAANHFALTVRPGWVRTLVLPWSRVAEVAAFEVAGERYLLVRCRDGPDRMGNTPHWLDQALLRELAKDGSKLARRHDLAVRMRDFVGTADHQPSRRALSPLE